MRLLVRGGSVAVGYGVSGSYVDLVRGPLLERGIEVVNRSRCKKA